MTEAKFIILGVLVSIPVMIIFRSKAWIVVGTINKELLAEKSYLKGKGFRTISVDYFRDKMFLDLEPINHKKAQRIAFYKFLLGYLTARKIAFFTSNPFSLENKILFLILGIKLQDERISIESNKIWVANLNLKQVDSSIPQYFAASRNKIFARKVYLRNLSAEEKLKGLETRRSTLLKELDRYPKNRFKEIT